MPMPSMVGMVVTGMVNARRSAPRTVHPTRIAVLIVLLLPDRHPMFDFVDDVSAGGEGFGAVTCAYAYPDGHVADREVSDAVHARGVFDTETGDCFGDDAFAFLDGE